MARDVLQNGSLSFSPRCCFQPNILRVGSIIFSKSWVPFDLIQCGICIDPNNFLTLLPLCVLSWNVSINILKHQQSSVQRMHWTVMVHDEVCVWAGHCGRSIFDDQNIKSLSEGSYSITSGFKWVFKVPSEEETAKAEVLACQGPATWGQSVGCSGTGVGQLTTQDKTEALGCVKFVMSLGYQHLKLFVAIPKPTWPLLSTKKMVFLRKNCNLSQALIIFRLELICDQSKRAPDLINWI